MQNYNNIQKFLHDFVLNKKIINKSLFELEKMIYLKNRDIVNQSHVFITGLARSGTTSLLNFLFSSDEYASLTYNNMPFILSPNFSKLFNKKNIIKKERLHGDGINFDNNSPEALDEVFFDNNEEFVKNELKNYIQLILLSNKKNKYLSKNNLSFKRIDLIQSILPNSIFLIPIREPLHQANSLLNQHLRFIQLQKENDFIRRYMNYLGHNEFGLSHKPWNKPINFNNLNNINYWLEQWNLFYEFIYMKFQSYENCYFVVYEELHNPNYVEKILKKINLEKFKHIDFKFFRNSNKKEINIEYDKNIFDKSQLLYQSFIQSK
ncbi:sulfotransferase [Candidatus Pelagibacter sp.]|uniref:sulfotransferase n=1 Tax=Candidatus Pelagibacter sp. TaxID=2024849 RepID=UPI003D1271E2